MKEVRKKERKEGKARERGKLRRMKQNVLPRHDDVDV